MKISAFEARIGNFLKFQKKIWKVLKKNHVKPGKGGAFVQLEMKCVSDHTKRNERFRSEDKVEKAHIESQKMQYLYSDGNSVIFMNKDTYEQISIEKKYIDAQVPFLFQNIDVQVNFYGAVPIGIELPSVVVLTVIDTESIVKGQTASKSGKPAILETKHKLSVPTFIHIGEKVKVSTENGEYMGRA